MNIKLNQDIIKINIDKETLEILEKLIGIDKCCYDWWELSQGIKDIAVGLYLLRKNKRKRR